MCVVYLGCDLESLAVRLADTLLSEERQGDFFAPATVIVPNRYLRKWLRLWLARRTGISINLRFPELEDGLWELLRSLDPRLHAPGTDASPRMPPEPLDANTYRLLVLSVLLQEREPSLAALQRYIQLQAGPLTRLSCRRAWQLADRIGSLIHQYEYHRQDHLIQPWLRGEAAFPEAGGFPRLMERAQRTVFAHIAEPRHGRRVLLGRQSGRSFATFAQYAMEVLAQPIEPRPTRTVHCFGLTQMSALHVHIIAWLGRAMDVRVYHPNVLAGRTGTIPSAESMRSIAAVLAEGEDREEGADPGKELLRPWARAGVEALGLISALAESDAFEVERLAPPTQPVARKGRGKAATVLSRVQDQLLGRSAGAEKLPQDTSLQIVACPGVVREVETAYNSILDNLQRDPDLRQSDIGVLVTDMTRYRPILQAVFERPPKPLHYNLVDFSAAGLSMMGQAVLGMLELALESFTRERVFAVLLNPCFLARLRIDRTQALTWLEWAETLGIYDGWDASEKQDRGYPHSPLYAWRLALQRLRLGRYMEVTAEDADGAAPRFGHVIPFADIHCSDREHLDAFCRAVETLLPALARLRHLNGTGQRWATALERLVLDFLDVPAERPEEEQVRGEILAALGRLTLWDHLRPASAPPVDVPLALVHEYLEAQLESLQGRHGEYLTTGITQAELCPMRPIPFKVLYVLGLDAELFPGSNALSSFDLRGAQREPGDIRPAEEKTYLLLENLLAAQQKIYLLHNSYDVARDQPLLASVPLAQLRRYLGDHVTTAAFATIEAPLHGDAEALYNQVKQPEYQDVLVQYQTTDRFLALAAAVQEGRLTLDLHQQAELAAKAESLKVEFAIVPEPRPASATPITVSIAELRRFLSFPAREILRRHLHVDEDDDAASLAEEPLITSDAAAQQIVRQALHQLIRIAMGGEIDRAIAEWPARFSSMFADGRLRCRVPEDAFGEIDEAALRAELAERIHGKGGLERFLRGRAAMVACGPTLMGESMTPVGAKARFPALPLRLDDGTLVRIIGSTPFAWLSRDTFEILAITESKKVIIQNLCQPMLDPLLLYLALLANPERNAKDIVPKEWLARRHFMLHLACPEGVPRWTHPIGLISSEEAERYLRDLVRDFLNPTQLDLLPFELIAGGVELRRVYDERTPQTLSAADYVRLLKERLADERENTFQRSVQIPLLVDMAGAQVPDDALAKVRRRFGLLDRGPARARRQPTARARRSSNTNSVGDRRS
jgi:exonuclease V gamma subunit